MNESHGRDQPVDSTLLRQAVASDLGRFRVPKHGPVGASSQARVVAGERRWGGVLGYLRAWYLRSRQEPPELLLGKGKLSAIVELRRASRLNGGTAR